jgi:hypothetical protein
VNTQGCSIFISTQIRRDAYLFASTKGAWYFHKGISYPSSLQYSFTEKRPRAPHLHVLNFQQTTRVFVDRVFQRANHRVVYQVRVDRLKQFDDRFDEFLSNLTSLPFQIRFKSENPENRLDESPIFISLLDHGKSIEVNKSTSLF